MMQEKECRPSLPPKSSDATCLLGVGNDLISERRDLKKKMDHSLKKKYEYD